MTKHNIASTKIFNSCQYHFIGYPFIQNDPTISVTPPVDLPGWVDSNACFRCHLSKPPHVPWTHRRSFLGESCALDWHWSDGHPRTTLHPHGIPSRGMLHHPPKRRRCESQTVGRLPCRTSNCKYHEWVCIRTATQRKSVPTRS